MTDRQDVHQLRMAAVSVLVAALTVAMAQADWPVTFVTEGLEKAISKAKEIAGAKTVAVASATIAQQCLNAGLLDEIHLDLVVFVKI